MAMSKIVKKKWVNALRSGKYRQGSGYLKDSEGGYCCLGVLCKITGQAHNRDMGNSWPVNFKDGEGGTAGPAPFMGLSTSTQETLAHMNDCSDDFKYIASYISKYIKAE